MYGLVADAAQLMLLGNIDESVGFDPLTLQDVVIMVLVCAVVLFVLRKHGRS